MASNLEVGILEQLYRLWHEKGGTAGFERAELAVALAVEISEVIPAVDELALQGLVEPLTMRRVRITQAGIDGREAEAGVAEEDARARQKIIERLGEGFDAKASRGIVYLKAEELGLDPAAFERNCWYLARAGLIEGVGIGSVYRIGRAGLERLGSMATKV